jgi:hypothetical protein
VKRRCDPFQVHAIGLERRGNRMEVDVETVEGDHVTVISEYDPYQPDVSPPHSTWVTSAGIRAACDRQDIDGWLCEHARQAADRGDTLLHDDLMRSVATIRYLRVAMELTDAERFDEWFERQMQGVVQVRRGGVIVKKS